MTEEQYLLELERLLMGMSVIERVDILRDVSEYFASGRLDGKSDAAMIEELGTPDALANELLGSVEPSSDVPKEPAVVKSQNVAFRNVSINVLQAHVQVVPSHDGFAYATLETERDHGVTMDIVGDTLEIRIESERRFGLSNLFAWAVTKAPVLHVELPRHAYEQVVIKNRLGSCDVRNLEAATVEVESENGTITANVIRAERGSFRSSNGKVSLTSMTGQTLDAQSSNGRVEVLASSVDRLDIQSSNGRLDIQDVNGAIDAKTSNGRIDCVVDALEHPVRLKTSNGRIDLRLKENPSDAVIRAKTRNGKVELFGDRANERTFGDGTVEVKLTSSNGSITVE
ncbi:DUF4097 family beta strand repeat-containing protein [Exiguobacterium sp.]|uniref:DUF4097 family beta strand repeat-containing protein n=1 Tax=Exiguobacterium sp. TaxID=44751 RepID=UPI00263B068A|nr:DUF4097 family beta strand repeat-containing protein [Exiguobacterium sp.]MCC5892789.1 DUF4097 family beta strand repeat protein [Exiguobacterium sp.]